MKWSVFSRCPLDAIPRSVSQECDDVRKFLIGYVRPGILLAWFHLSVGKSNDHWSTHDCKLRIRVLWPNHGNRNLEMRRRFFGPCSCMGGCSEWFLVRGSAVSDATCAGFLHPGPCLEPFYQVLKRQSQDKVKSYAIWSSMTNGCSGGGKVDGSRKSRKSDDAWSEMVQFSLGFWSWTWKRGQGNKYLELASVLSRPRSNRTTSWRIFKFMGDEKTSFQGARETRKKRTVKYLALSI